MVVPSNCHSIVALQILTVSTWHFRVQLYLKWYWDVCWEGTVSCHISAPTDSTGAHRGPLALESLALLALEQALAWKRPKPWENKRTTTNHYASFPNLTCRGFPPNVGHVWAPSTSGSSWQRSKANVSGLLSFSLRMSDAASDAASCNSHILWKVHLHPLAMSHYTRYTPTYYAHCLPCLFNHSASESLSTVVGFFLAFSSFFSFLSTFFAGFLAVLLRVSFSCCQVAYTKKLTNATQSQCATASGTPERHLSDHAIWLSENSWHGSAQFPFLVLCAGSWHKQVSSLALR